MKKLCLILMLGSLNWSVGQAQEVIELTSPPTPNSLSWTHAEKEYFSPIWNTQVITNVSKPTLTVYRPEEGKANGTSVVICPGGGFRALSINSEGIDVAKWLNERGVTAFVLKYRLVPTGEDGVKEMMSLGADREKADQD
ncbi:MAG: alpha/beta hydrolase, partial [Cyclobacteriaceae bacterium]